MVVLERLEYLSVKEGIEMKENENNLDYMDRFWDSKFTPYDFMSLFCAVLGSQKQYSFSRNCLIEFIQNCKESCQYTDLLETIPLKNNVIVIFSSKLEEAITKLKFGHILYTISPEKDSEIFIFQDIPISDLMKSRVRYINSMLQFVDNYNKYKLEKSPTAPVKTYVNN